MKNFFAILLFSFVFVRFLLAQNLVPNPSFEDTVFCPDANGIVSAAGWSSYGQSSDYFNKCSNDFPSLYRPGVPLNGFGFQYAANGNAYCGVFTYGFGGNYREFIGSQLITPLEIGNKYFISMKVSLAEGSNCVTNNIGVLFSSSVYNDSISAPINNHAHARSTAIITDTIEWIAVSGSFIADSAYQYIIIGNFYDDLQTDSIIYSGNICNAYYYVDDVCVSEDSLVCALNTSISADPLVTEKNISPNPANGKIYINLDINTPVECTLLTLSGYMVKAIAVRGNSEIDISDIPTGIYVLKIQFKNKTQLIKQIIIH